MKEVVMLKFSKEKLFNNKLLRQYDENGQLGFLGYLLRYKQWNIVDNNIVFPEIKGKEQISNTLKEYENNIKMEITKIRQETLRNASSLGIEFCEKLEESRLKHIQNTQKKQNKKSRIFKQRMER